MFAIAVTSLSEINIMTEVVPKADIFFGICRH
jgi:hypothetical protein